MPSVKTLCAAFLLASTSVTMAGAQTPAGDPPDKPRTRVDWNPRPSLRIGDAARIDFRLKLQLDLRAFSPDQPVDDGTFQLHRRRAAVEGTLFKRVDFQVERELRERGPWRDVYADARIDNALQFQGGKFKMPFGLEETTGTMDLDFIYRTVGTVALTPARDVGGMAHGRLGRTLEYEAGAFRHDGEGALSEEGFLLPGEEQPRAERAIAARVLATPWGRGGGSRPRLGLAATSSAVPEGLNSVAGRSVFRSTFFPRLYVRGRRMRIGAQAEWNPGPFGFRSEYIRVSEDRNGQGLGDVDLSALIGRSWYASATWVVTGEKKGNGIGPRRPLLQGGIGSIEVAARFERAALGSAAHDGPAFRNPRADNVLGNAERVWTTGANWYVNRWFKVQANGIREMFEDAQRTPVSGHTTFWSGVIRLQAVL
jgi:phosphate-selective porin OprO/OprP